MKNGQAFDKMYSCKVVVFSRPNMFVLADRFPELRHLTKDRWLIANVTARPQLGAELLRVAQAPGDGCGLASKIEAGTRKIHWLLKPKALGNRCGPTTKPQNPLSRKLSRRSSQ